MFFINKTFDQQWDRLVDLNVHVIKFLLEQFNIKTPIYFESEIKTTNKSTARIIEICSKLKANSYLSGVGGKNYLEENLFKDAGIQLQYQSFQHPTYEQQFLKNEQDFTPYMSAIDLLFNAGEQSIKVIREGQEKDKGKG